MVITRRMAFFGGACLPVTAALGSPVDPITAIEKRTGGRLGVAVLDTQTGRRLEHRAQERFAMCSTFKFLAVAAVLARVDANKEHLDRFLAYGESDLVVYSPVTKMHAGEGGMTLAALCEAAIVVSDNTAANLLLGTMDGPACVTRVARALGDTVTRLDRNEPTLNSATPGDLRDTTTPAAMLCDLREILLGKTLSDSSREMLEGWMVGNKISQHLLRAGLPADWRVADKTGGGGYHSRNDIAVLWPPNRAPILASVFFAESDLPNDALDATIAAVGRVIAAGF